MAAVRQDAWTNEEDSLLAETVLKHIREGSTQLQAFAEVGKKLSRTPAACGFRWNSALRKRYKNEIEWAKKQRKALKKASGTKKNQPAKPGPFPAPDVQALDQFIVCLEQLKTYLTKVDGYVQQMGQENEKVKELEKRIESLERENRMISQDYLALLAIMEKARKMTEKKETRNDGPEEKKEDADGGLP
nr:RsfA family transcriptional regulator [Bacillaceae bacterium]